MVSPGTTDQVLAPSQPVVDPELGIDLGKLQAMQDNDTAGESDSSDDEEEEEEPPPCHRRSRSRRQQSRSRRRGQADQDWCSWQCEDCDNDEMSPESELLLKKSRKKYAHLREKLLLDTGSTIEATIMKK